LRTAGREVMLVKTVRAVALSAIVALAACRTGTDRRYTDDDIE
jgi:hypothetical protein